VTAAAEAAPTGIEVGQIAGVFLPDLQRVRYLPE